MGRRLLAMVRNHSSRARTCSQTPCRRARPFAPSPRRTSRLAVVLAVVAILLAGAALVVSLVRKPETPVTAQPTPRRRQRHQRQRLRAADICRRCRPVHLCQAIAPLDEGIDEQTREFAALARFARTGSSDTRDIEPSSKDGRERFRPILNKFMRATAILTRTLQRFIDDKLLYVRMVQPGHVDPVDEPTWKQASIDYGGPLGTCSKLWE